MRIFPLNENALTVEFGDVISPELNSRAIELCRRIARDPFPGFIEAVPAYSTVTVFYDLTAVRSEHPGSATAFERVRETISSMIVKSDSVEESPSRKVTIQAKFGGDDGPDLVTAAALSGLAPKEFISIFLEQEYRVYMLGFLPGFPYMGEVDERIAVPRLASPRTCVPRGSVGIAGRQTGIYPLDSPGGWQLIGRTDLKMFEPKSDPPVLLQPGDLVTFRSV